MAFQSTLPRGSDHEKRGAEPIPVSFQSTLPRGSDLRLHYAISVQRRDFNPRSLAGATPSVKGREQAGEISIHAPSRERQQVIARRQREYRHFNPRSLAGATFFHYPLPVLFLFQSTLPRGSDLWNFR